MDWTLGPDGVLLFPLIGPGPLTIRQTCLTCHLTHESTVPFDALIAGIRETGTFHIEHFCVGCEQKIGMTFAGSAIEAHDPGAPWIGPDG